MLLLLLNYVVLRALWKIDVHLISTLVNKSLYYHYYYYYYLSKLQMYSHNATARTTSPCSTFLYTLNAIST